MVGPGSFGGMRATVWSYAFSDHLNRVTRLPDVGWWILHQLRWKYYQGADILTEISAYPFPYQYLLSVWDVRVWDRTADSVCAFLIERLVRFRRQHRTLLFVRDRVIRWFRTRIARHDEQDRPDRHLSLSYTPSQ